MTLSPMPPKAEHGHIGAGFDTRGPHHRADAGGDAAADVTGLVEWRILADFGDGIFRQHSEVRKSRTAHIVSERFGLSMKSG